MNELFNAPTEYNEVVELAAAAILEVGMGCKEASNFKTAIFGMFFDRLGSEQGSLETIKAEKKFRLDVDKAVERQDKEYSDAVFESQKANAAAGNRVH